MWVKTNVSEIRYQYFKLLPPVLRQFCYGMCGHTVQPLETYGFGHSTEFANAVVGDTLIYT